MMEPNEAMKAMARRIAADFYEAHDRLAFQLFAPAVRAGKHDDDEAVQSALAAIMETQEACAKLADQLAQSTHLVGGLQDWLLSFDERQICTDLATAIRTGEHYALAGER